MTRELTTIDLVAEFHRIFRVFELEEPGIPPAQSCYIRMQLIDGEKSELAQALAAQDQVGVLDALCDLQYVIDGTLLVFGIRSIQPFLIPEYNCIDGWKNFEDSIVPVCELSRNFAKFIFNLAQKNVSSIGFYLQQMENNMFFAWRQLGFQDVKWAAFTEVHASNMSKLDASGQPIVSPSGKVLKGPNFFAPNLAQFLK